MSIFKKLFGGESAVPKELKPRAPRIRLQNVHGVSLTSPRWTGKSIGVLNISTTGVGADPTGCPPDIQVGTVIPGLLSLQNAVYPILLRVAQMTDKIVGFAFEGETSQLREAIFNHFVAEISGMEVTQVNPKFLKSDNRGEPHWFYGANNSEIYFTLNNEKISYFHITLLGNYIECYQDQLPRFGYVISQEGRDKMKPDPSPMIRFTEEMPNSTMELFRKFVKNVSSIKPEEKTVLLNSLSKISSI